ncbi:hypothetical protein V5799_033467 [Amblyomma americanum]|uniref:M13 family peptidase n=1 Tax=Amblyomma americanum TaxID=6943 RepID=A0AAQ4DN84_AMBAM
MAVTGALLLYLMPRSAISKMVKRTSLCITPGCRHHADVIAAWVNTSVDPCEDFEAYACSRWASKSRDRPHGTAMMAVAENSWIEDFRPRLEQATQSIHLARQLEVLFDTCVKRRPAEHAITEISQIKEFMRELKLRWPQPPLQGVEPLGVIFNLVFNWAINIWFRGYLETNDKGDSRNLVLQPGTLFSERWAFAQDVFNVNAYVKYWTGFHLMFAPGEAVRSHVEISKMATMEENIYRDFIRAENSSLKNPAYIHLEAIRDYTPHIPTHQWLDALNNYLVGQGQFLASDGVTAADVDLLRAVNNLFANFSREQLLDHISWEFVQLLAPLASSDFLVAKLGDKSRAKIEVNHFCATEIDRAYRWLVTAALLLPRFDVTARAAMDEELENITHTAIAKVSSLSWADNTSAQTVADRLQNIRVTIWPPNSLLTNTELDETFGSWFRKDFTFTQHFILALRNWQRFRMNPSYKSTADSPPPFELPFLNYDPVSNAVRISAAALFLPWYHFEESKATFYGGFGFTFAGKVVRSFDGFTLAFDRMGKLLKTWPSAAWKEASEDKAQCLRPEFDTFFPEIPALEIAHAVYLASQRDGLRSLPIAKGWSPDRVFFVTACFTMCSMPTTLSRFRLACNKAMMNSAPFAKAFDCPVYSKMNPPRKCTYFD